MISCTSSLFITALFFGKASQYMISFSEISALGVLLEPEAGHFSLISSVCSLHNKTFTVLWNTLMEVVV